MFKEERDQASLGIQLIHQDPFAALNPTRTIFQTLSAPLRIHGIAARKQNIQQRLHDLLQAVGLTPPKDFLTKYPHQLNGGQRQRIVIARALSVNPSVLVADEIPDATQMPSGCSFANRCPFATDICRFERPPLRPAKLQGHLVA
ncbi:MAG: ATP-binding cassette domain-containing protein [Alicyclobacillus sp.]|nr:ATP-binding cassette domain-containing protein [Alicyclobacillus sp.]